MALARVFILASQALFAKGVQSLLSEQPGITIAGSATVGPEALGQLRAVNPDAVIVEATGENQSKLVASVLEAAPNARVIGLTLDDNSIHTYTQQMKRSSSVDDLLEAIRTPDWESRSPEMLRLFVLFQGQYGQRILDNVRRFAPKTWKIEAWRAPDVLPQVVDDPAEFLPLHLPIVDLVLSLGENASVAQLLPGVVDQTGAQAVIAPIDNADWLPDGLARQLSAQLTMMDVVAVFPKPFCSLTEDSYNVQKHKVSFDSAWIAEFAHHFGQPVFQVECTNGKIVQADVKRDTACGCARDVARQLAGIAVDDAAIKTGLFQHHYPCLATMRVDVTLEKPLIQISGNLMRQAVEIEIEACLPEKGGDLVTSITQENLHAEVDTGTLGREEW